MRPGAAAEPEGASGFHQGAIDFLPGVRPENALWRGRRALGAEAGASIVFSRP